jgi:hypothetical protein
MWIAQKKCGSWMGSKIQQLVMVILLLFPWFVLENVTTEPHEQDVSADILRVRLSDYILQHKAKGRRFDTLETAKSGCWVRKGDLTD